MNSFATMTTIRARPDAIWVLLTDAHGFTLWNSTVERVDGNIAPGEKVTVYAKASPRRAFPLKVSTFTAPETMVWSGGMPLGLFTGRRTFTLTPSANGETHFSMREEFSGLLAPLITKSIPDLQPSFDRFGADLKQRAEQVS